MVYRVHVNGQHMSMCNQNPEIVSGSRNFIRFIFDLSADWNGLTVFAQFKQNGQTYNRFLDDENSVYLPSEVTKGTCHLMLYGSSLNEYNFLTGTTEFLSFRILDSGYVADSSSTEIPESLYDALVSRINEAIDEMRSGLSLATIDASSAKESAAAAEEYGRVAAEYIDKADDHIVKNFMDALHIQKIDDYFYSADVTDMDYQVAKEWMNDKFSPYGFCSSLRNGNFYGRNYDWKYDDAASFMIRTPEINGKHASIGVVGGLPTLTDEVVSSLEYNELYKVFWAYTLDGINSKGVIANINVVPNGDNGLTTGSNPDSEFDLCGLMAVRYILDYADSALEAVHLLEDANIYMPQGSELSQECHFMIADEDETYIVEFIDNVIHVMSDSEDDDYDGIPNDMPIMTNFYLSGWNGSTARGFYGDEAEPTLTPHASGLERYDILANKFADADTKDGMFDALKAVRYTKCYDNTIRPYWFSEFVGTYDRFGDLTVNSPKEDFKGIVKYCTDLFREHKRNGSTWQTVHSSCYDIDSKVLYIKVQEKNKIYSFALDKIGETVYSTEKDLQTVKSSILGQIQSLSEDMDQFGNKVVLEHNDNGQIIAKTYNRNNELIFTSEGIDLISDEVLQDQIENYLNENPIDVPLATTTIKGSVLSSNEVNSVSVSDTGVMEVNEIGLDKIIDSEIVDVVFNGGNAV